MALKRARALVARLVIVDAKEQEEPVARWRLVRTHQGGMPMRAPLVEAEQDGSIRIQDLTKDIGFVDAAVLAVVERLDEPKLATLDHRHFGVVRPRHVDTLRLLPEGG
jgi:hypothetical protein